MKNFVWQPTPYDAIEKASTDVALIYSLMLEAQTLCAEPSQTDGRDSMVCLQASCRAGVVRLYCNIVVVRHVLGAICILRTQSNLNRLTIH